MNKKKFLQHIVIIVAAIFGAIFTWTSINYFVNEKQTIFTGEEFFLLCLPYNFEIDGNRVTSVGDDPQLYFEYTLPTHYKYVVVTLSELSADTVMQVFWKYEGGELSEGKSSIKEAAIGANNFNIAKGITLLRFDLAADNGVSMVVDSVTFINVIKRTSPLLSLFYALIFSAFCIIIMFLILVLEKTGDIEKTFSDVILKSDGVTFVFCRVRQFIGIIFPFLFLLLIFGIYIYKPFYLLFDSPEFTAPGINTNKPMWLLENFVITVPSVCLMLLVKYIIRKGKIAANINEKTKKIIVNSVILCFFILIFINKLSLFSDETSYDNTIVRGGAYGIMNNGIIPEGVQHYLLFARNNRGIVLLLGLLGRIANDLLIPYRLLWIFIDSIFITLAVLFVYLTVKLLCNSQVSLITLIFTFAFLFFSACITPLANTRGDWYTCYTDSSSMPFTTISVYCFTRFIALNDNKQRKVILVLLGSISSAIGFLFKPTALITVIAFILILLLNRKNAKKNWNLLPNVMFVIFGLCFAIIPFEKVYNHFETIDAKPTASMAHMLVLGMLNTMQNINENGVMVFNDPPSLDPFKDRGRWNYAEAGFPVKQVLIERIKIMNIALLEFYYLKDVNNLSFTYGFHSSAFSKGNSPESFYKASFLRKWRSLLLRTQIPIRAVLWNVIFWQSGIWAYFIIKKKQNLSQAENFLSITMLGVFAYLTLFESGDRYVMQFWPIFLIVSSLGLCLQNREQSK